ncbi:MAG: shikimate kinase [Anaerovoracaceae bacterium]
MAAYGLIGKNISYSYSKKIHLALGKYDYMLHSFDEEAFQSYMKKRSFKGLNITIPYKQAVMEFCDQLDEKAKRIGAVNTLYFQGTTLRGTNTDYHGFLTMARRAKISFYHKKVLILGTGGAALTVAAVATDLGASSITFASRTGPVTYDCLPTDAEIIVNATPVGTYPHVEAQPVDLANFPYCCGVLDLIYNPFKTRLLLQAEQRGIPCSNGLSMLVAQATLAAEYFLYGKALSESEDGGEDCPEGFSKENQRILTLLAKEMRNIVLIGMPGCGKSTLGKALARALSMRFVDTDKLLGDAPEKIISQQGIQAFRQLETAAIKAAAREHGQVIATGGGAVLNPENIAALKQNGIIVFVHREIQDLSTKNRPLSQGPNALEHLAEQRLPLYRAYGEITIKNNGTVDSAVNELLTLL